jgi:hypothetical protein
MLKRLLGFLRTGILFPFAGGLVADEAAEWGLLGAWSNANAYCGGLLSFATAGTAYVVTTAQMLLRVIRLTSGASGGFTITLPATVALIGALGPTIQTDGTYGKPFSILNDGIGQTGTLTAGDASTTLTGTMTIATNTRRDFFLTVTGVSTVTIQNVGSAAI